jgi:hypothetical protein
MDGRRGRRGFIFCSYTGSTLAEVADEVAPARSAVVKFEVIFDAACIEAWGVLVAARTPVDVPWGLSFEKPIPNRARHPL